MADAKDIPPQCFPLLCGERSALCSQALSDSMHGHMSLNTKGGAHGAFGVWPTCLPSTMNSAEPDILEAVILPKRKRAAFQAAFEASILSESGRTLAEQMGIESRDVVLWSPRTQRNRFSVLNNFARFVSLDPKWRKYVDDELNVEELAGEHLYLVS